MATNRGYNALGARNNIIMLYPDSKCWDNTGDIDPENFNKKTGLIPSAFKQMIDRVTIDPNASDCDSLNCWLDEQVIPPHPGQECVSKFRVHNVDSTKSYRLFHGHDCGTLSYTLIS